MNKSILAGVEIPSVIFGGNVFGWTMDAKSSLALLDKVVAAGLVAIDTADYYSRFVPGNVGGESESLIGEWIRTRGGRERLYIATKCGLEMGEGKSGLSRRHITQAIDDSLKRLATDYVDLYQAHRDDPETPLEETLQAFGDLVKSGKARAIGLSNYSAARLSEAIVTSARIGGPKIASMQLQYNLYNRQAFEQELRPVCVANNVAVICYSALANGFLSGKYRSEKDFQKSKRGGLIKQYLDARGLRILDALDAVGAATKAAPSEVAIAWLAAQPGVTAPIASATDAAQLESLVKATSLKLTAQQLAELTAASANGASPAPVAAARAGASPKL